MLTGNKGEWSEAYTFFKILSDGFLYAADSDLNKLEHVYYPIIKILRNQSGNNLEYLRNGEIKLVDGNNNQIIATIPIKEFSENALILLNKIRCSSGAFAAPEIEEFMTKIRYTTLTAPATDKTDITLVVHDLNTGLKPTLGFSIKSRLGHPSTLLNASRATNFIFKISDVLTDNVIDKINSISTRSKIKDRLQNIESYGAKLIYLKTESRIFELNLQLIDSNLPRILSEILIKYYQGEATDIATLTKLVEIDNPCNYQMDYNHSFYTYKAKAFLTDIALGMKPNTVWNGQYNATGGYIIVREDGEVLCYHLYNRNEFGDYLLKNTKLDTPSSSRHNFGSILKDDSSGELLFKLNMQIRFKI